MFLKVDYVNMVKLVEENKPETGLVLILAYWKGFFSLCLWCRV